MKVFITGISGQDGYYLTHHLLNKGYEIHGMVRRHSVAENQQYRLDEFRDKIYVHYGDMTDQTSLEKLLGQIKPNYIFNLAAQSHVRISFEIPQYTFQANALGVLNLLEAYRRLCPGAKFYQASSSEMFGLSIDEDNFQRETTPMNPVSPYGCAKVAAYNLVRHYRRAYGLFACNGILFNHECITHNNPLLIKQKDVIKIMRPSDIRKARIKCANIQQWRFDDLYIWDGEKFSKLLTMTATRRKTNNSDFACRIVNTRNGIIETTNHHNIYKSDNKKLRCGSLNIGDKLLHGDMPINAIESCMNIEEAEFLGFMVADGWVSEDGIGSFNKKDINILNRVNTLWTNLSMGYTHLDKERKTEYGTSIIMRLNGNSNYLKYIHNQIYTFDKYKKVPERILNGSYEIKIAFLRGYNKCDGLKANNCNYEFKNFKTNSSVLALGLLYLIYNTTGQSYNITLKKKNNKIYYSINFHSTNNYNNAKVNSINELLQKNVLQRSISKILGVARSTIRKIQNNKPVFKEHYAKCNPYEIKKILPSLDENYWVYDLEVESGKFMCGVGNVIVANSPYRGSNFVTQKIIKTAVMIKKRKAKTLELGNLDSSRDWGHSYDYTNAMTKIIEHNTPDDFVVSSMETKTVRQLCELVFGMFDMDYKDYVVQNPKYMRPEELPFLCGDSTKARTILGWKPEYTFDKMIKEMVEYWLIKLNK